MIGKKMWGGYVAPIRSPDLNGSIWNVQGESPDVGAMHVFRLYVADQTPNSLRAKTNLQLICDNYFSGHSRIEEVDILQEPLRCLSDGILVTPTLIRLSPLPELKIVGDLSDKSNVLMALGLEVDST